ncbi:MAG: hypothetical protein HY540_01355, partial [Deltaproteobacteria bacterium]|nr:hypothetical protein [Deltaproteobacteria bacterium]
MFLFFTDILHREIMDRYGRFLGYPFDFTAKFDEPYPRLTSIILSRSRFCRRYLEIPWTDVQFNDEHFSLRHALDTYSIKSEYRRDGVPTLRHNVLDQQVVDTFNRKLVRINDLHLLSVGGELRIAHVDIGIRGLVRRLGWEPAVDFVVRAFNRHATYLNVSSFIGWKYIQPLSIQDAAGKIQLNVDQQTLRSIPPSD